ncbi:MAG: PH domain-containing protein [Deltaproteobacteria bacterium]|nr:PH domain-containing protein [Deltaproteobacteria bacterium]
MRQFPMSLSTGVRILSWAVVLLVCAVPLFTWSVLPGITIGGPRGPGGPGVDVARWVSLLAPLIAVVSWALGPRGLEIEGGELRILRNAWRASAVPLSGIQEVAILPPGSLRGAIRTFGNGGLFGYYGWYYRRGAFRLYATRRDRLVEIVAAGKRIVVSPDEPGRFVEGLLSRAPRARLRQPGEAGAPGAASASRRS